jgi:hypothetical protein
MTTVDKTVLSDTDKYTLHFIMECSADRMPNGDGSIEGPRYAKGFPTQESAKAWLRAHGRQLRITTAWVTVMDVQEDPDPKDGNKSGLHLVH